MNLRVPVAGSSRRSNRALALLAGLLAAGVIVQAARLAGLLVAGAPASADMVNQSNDFQVLSVDAGSSDVVLMIDQRTESILIYHATQSGLKFLGRRDIRDVFAQARAAAGR